MISICQGWIYVYCLNILTLEMPLRTKICHPSTICNKPKAYKAHFVLATL